MKTAGIIAEYNPFHNGHKYHIDQARKITGADCIIAVMSGPFTQRGLPACIDKWSRAAMAIEAGVDLVIELPFIYACNSGAEFATGAVGILDGLGCVDNLVFGAEIDDYQLLLKAAEASADIEGVLDEPIKKNLSEGVSYARAFSDAIGEVYGENIKAVLETPNNLLGVEYLKALFLRDSAIKAVPVLRKGAAHGDLSHGVISSGTAVRNIMDKCFATGCDRIKHSVPESSFEILMSADFKHSGEVKNSLFDLLRYKISTTSAERLGEIYSVDEGIENRLKKLISEFDIGEGNPYDEYTSAVKSKRFTLARLNRMMTYILTDLTASDFNRLKGTYYARVIGFNNVGRKLLKELSKISEIPVFVNYGQVSSCAENVQKCFEYDTRAADLFSMTAGNGIIGNDKKKIPYMLGYDR